MKLAPPSVLLAEITVAEALEPYLNDRIQHSERSLVGARTMNNQAVEMYKQSNKDAKRLLAQGISAIEVGDMVESDMLHSHDAAEEVVRISRTICFIFQFHSFFWWQVTTTSET